MRTPEHAEIAELTAKHGETEKRRDAETAVRRAGLRSGPADSAESDRKHERLWLWLALVFPIRSGSVRRFATPVEPLFLPSSPFLCASVFCRFLHNLRDLRRFMSCRRNISALRVIVEALEA